MSHTSILLPLALIRKFPLLRNIVFRRHPEQFLIIAGAVLGTMAHFSIFISLSASPSCVLLTGRETAEAILFL